MASFKHGKTGSRLYEVWHHMKSRCYYTKNKNYNAYGGRGIAVCDEWKNDFMSFYNWAMENGYDDTLTIDRIDNNKGYSPNNCRWATAKQQVMNRTNTLQIAYKGKTKPLMEWCEILNLSYNTIWTRLHKYNWTVEKAFTKGVK